MAPGRRADLHGRTAGSSPGASTMPRPLPSRRIGPASSRCCSRSFPSVIPRVAHGADLRSVFPPLEAPFPGPVTWPCPDHFPADSGRCHCGHEAGPVACPVMREARVETIRPPEVMPRMLERFVEVDEVHLSLTAYHAPPMRQ